jgi:hypothetical protein
MLKYKLHVKNTILNVKVFFISWLETLNCWLYLYNDLMKMFTMSNFGYFWFYYYGSSAGTGN